MSLVPTNNGLLADVRRSVGLVRYSLMTSLEVRAQGEVFILGNAMKWLVDRAQALDSNIQVTLSDVPSAEW